MAVLKVEFMMSIVLLVLLTVPGLFGPLSFEIYKLFQACGCFHGHRIVEATLLLDC